ncbi:MAG: hypothetical protein JO264_02205 [Acidisphaera sp.]|nr:hypothetical protein [Acidisphaera sp.]
MEVAIEEVRGVLRDDLPIEQLRMEMPDGEILTLREENGHVILAVVWNDFAARRQETVVYTLLGGRIVLRR